MIYMVLSLLFFSCFLSADDWSEQNSIVLQKEIDESKYEVTQLLVSDFEQNRKNAEEDNAGMSELKQTISLDSVRDKKKLSSADSALQETDNLSRLTQDVFRQNNAKMHGSGAVSNMSPFMPKSPAGADYYLEFGKVTQGDGHDFSDKLKEEIKVGLGEEAYAKMVWTYGQIQDIDNWINSNMAQYGFEGGYLFDKQKNSIIDLNEQLNVLVIFQHENSAIEGGGISKNSRKISWEADGIGNRPLLVEGYQHELMNDHIQGHKLAFILKYLTIINLVYLLFIVMFIGILVRGFKFLVRQQ